MDGNEQYRQQATLNLRHVRRMRFAKDCAIYPGTNWQESTIRK